MSNDIHQILQKLSLIEAKITPAMPSIKGLNSQQKSVPQLPALFKPHDIKALGSKKDPSHPMKGYMVGSNESTESTKSALEEAMGEIEEDMLSKVKKDLTTYLDKLEQKIKIDSDIKDKAKDEIHDKNPAKADDQDWHEEEIEEDPTQSEPPPEVDPQPVMNPVLPECDAPVKIFTLEDGTCLECYGDEGRGFELRHNGRSMPSRFPKLDHADMAVKLWQHHRKKNDLSQDYIEER